MAVFFEEICSKDYERKVGLDFWLFLKRTIKDFLNKYRRGSTSSVRGHLEKISP